MHFLVDMNLSRQWAQCLVDAGHEATYWRDVGPANARDSEIMDIARTQNLVVLTRDLDFGELLATNNATGPSVVQIRSGDPMPNISGPHVMNAIERFAAEIESGALVTISLSSAKVRILPIKRADT